MPAETITTADACRFLDEHHPVPVVDVQPLVGGHWSQAFGFRTGDAELVVRFGHQLDDYRKDQRASTWRSPALPIPELLEVGPAFDRHFAISSRAYGEPLEDAHSDEWATLVPRVLDLIARTAALPVDGDGFGWWLPQIGAPHSTWAAFLLGIADDDQQQLSRIRGWKPKLARHPEADATFARGLRALERVTEDLAVPRCVVHADLINRNALVRGSDVTGVFDWGSSLYGDPLYDVAWIGFWSPWHPNLATVDIVEQARSSTQRFGAADDFDRRIASCQLHIGLGHLAYNAYVDNRGDLARVALAVEGIARRWGG